MRITTLCLSVTCLVAVSHITLVDADEKLASETVAGVPELKVLDRLRGEWNGALEGGDSKLTQTSRWILKGHVLETTFQLDDDLHGRLLRTYDADDREYVATYMDSAGSVVLMTGSWDDQQQTLTTSGKNGQQTVTLATRFVDEQTTRWSITQVSRGGETSQVSGTNRRIGN